MPLHTWKPNRFFSARLHKLYVASFKLENDMLKSGHLKVRFGLVVPYLGCDKFAQI